MRQRTGTSTGAAAERHVRGGCRVQGAEESSALSGEAAVEERGISGTGVLGTAVRLSASEMAKSGISVLIASVSVVEPEIARGRVEVGGGS